MLVAFKPADLKLIREHAFLGGDLEKRQRLGEATPGGGVKVRLTADDLDELLGYLAAASNHASSPALQRKLDVLYGRLQRLEESLASAQD